MLSSLLVVLTTLWFAAAAPPAAQATYCSEDNLLRAFQHTPTPASQYCVTSTGYPTFLAVTTYPPSRLTSVCSCFSRIPFECTGGTSLCAGSCVNTQTDPNNCGGCGKVCGAGAANTSPTCSGGVCSTTCTAGYGDCDGDPSNGCETSLTVDGNCGACGVSCYAHYVCVTTPGPPLNGQYGCIV